MVVTARQVARIESWPGGDLVVVGWDHVAECGCTVMEAMTIGVPVQEPRIALVPCSEGHGMDMAGLHESLAHDRSEPDRPIHDVIEERFGAVAAGWEEHGD